ncbi:MAG: dihydrolipoyl dehydrogenase [Actinomycetota bacterium]
MVVGELSDRVDVVVIGGGPGGYTAALALAEHGRQVTLIERDAVGGVCLNVGCIPSKALIHQGDLARLGARGSAAGIAITTIPDPVAMATHRREVVTGLTNGVAGLLARAKVDVRSGVARFARADRLVIAHGDTMTHLEFDHCVVATGSRPTVIPGLEPGPRDGLMVLDSTGALSLAEIPERLVVVGGGYIGVELGTAWAKLGSQVTIVELADRLLPAMDSALGRAVARRLKDLDVEVRTGTRVDRLEPGTVVVDAGDPIQATHVIVAVGRTANTDELNLAAAGVGVDDGGRIPVGPDRRAAGRVWAIGDVTDGPALAHKATAEARVVADAIAGRSAAFDPAVIPEVVFSDPEVASVGQSDGASRSRMPFTANGRAATLGDTAGFVQLVADDQGTLVGAQLAGHGVSEMIAELALAIEMAATVTDVAATIHPHPTLSEAIGEVALTLDERA